ncbi:MAG: 6-phosphogluconolactonase [bacterium]
MSAPWPGEIVVRSDAADVARAAAERIAEASARAVAERGEFSIALAGGTTPAATYALLASAPLRDTIAWSAWRVFFGDERWVAPDHPDSNFGMASRTLLSRVPIDAARVHPIPTDMPDAEQAAEAYERLLRANLGAAVGATPQLDMVLLGMGDDAHTASLFAGSPLLAERARAYGAALRPADASIRVSATPALICASREIAVIVTGSAKSAPIVRAWASAAATSDVPITLLHEARGSVTWFCDAAAATPPGGAVPATARFTTREACPK